MDIIRFLMCFRLLDSQIAELNQIVVASPLASESGGNRAETHVMFGRTAWYDTRWVSLWITLYHTSRKLSPLAFLGKSTCIWLLRKTLLYRSCLFSSIEIILSRLVKSLVWMIDGTIIKNPSWSICYSFTSVAHSLPWTWVRASFVCFAFPIAINFGWCQRGLSCSITFSI